MQQHKKEMDDEDIDEGEDEDNDEYTDKDKEEDNDEDEDDDKEKDEDIDEGEEELLSDGPVDNCELKAFVVESKLRTRRHKKEMDQQLKRKEFKNEKKEMDTN